MSQIPQDDDIVMQPNEVAEITIENRFNKRKRPENQAVDDSDEPDNITPTKSNKKERQLDGNTSPNRLVIRSQLGENSPSATAPPSPSPNSQNERSPLIGDPAGNVEETPSQIYNIYASNTPNSDAGGTPNPPERGQPTRKSLKERFAEAEERGETITISGSGPRDPLQKYTDEVMPKVHVTHPMAPLSNMDIDAIGEWENLTGSKLLAQPFGSYPTRLKNHNVLKALIFGAVIEITKSRNVAVCAPRQSPTTNKIPITFLIYDLTESQKETLLRRGVWSSANITFRVIPMEPSCPDYLFTIRGITSQKDGDIKRAVERVWRDEASTAAIRSILAQSQEPNNRQSQRDTAEFIKSAKIEPLDTKGPGGIPAPTYRVFAQGSLIEDEGTWCKLRNYLASRPYEIRFQDVGEAFIPSRSCGICHGADHPKGLCPFPALNDWNGPTNDEEPELIDPERRGKDPAMSRDRDRKRGRTARFN